MSGGPSGCGRNSLGSPYNAPIRLEHAGIMGINVLHLTVTRHLARRGLIVVDKIRTTL